LAVSFLLAAAASPDEATEAAPRVTVWLYDYARVSRETLENAKSKAGRIFLQAGVRLAWVDCPRSMEEIPKYPACQGVLRPTRLVLRILSGSAASGANSHSKTCGRAALREDGGFGLQAGVYASCAEGRPVLGHLMAHELGHLLIGTRTHSPAGVMQTDWSPTQVRHAAQGRLLFSTKDALRIRAQVRERMRAERAGS